MFVKRLRFMNYFWNKIAHSMNYDSVEVDQVQLIWSNTYTAIKIPRFWTLQYSYEHFPEQNVIPLPRFAASLIYLCQFTTKSWWTDKYLANINRAKELQYTFWLITLNCLSFQKNEFHFSWIMFSKQTDITVYKKQFVCHFTKLSPQFWRNIY